MMIEKDMIECTYTNANKQLQAASKSGAPKPRRYAPFLLVIIKVEG
jgi:hypothetical protein